MPGASRWLASAAVGGILLLSTGARAEAQSGSGSDGQSVGRVASFAPGTINGVVLDELGKPVEGAMVTGLGASTAFTLTDRFGRFELRALPPGPYLVRAHLGGYVAPKAQLVEVRPSARASSSISLKRPVQAPQVLAAGIGTLPIDVQQPTDLIATDPAGDAEADSSDDTDESERAWRVRHLRRGVLKDALIPDELLAERDSPAGAFTPVDFLGRAAESSARFATNFFATTSFSGQVNLLTSGSFDAPRDLFSTNTLSRNIANVSVSAPVGTQADWTVRGAFSEADITSWIVAGSYKTRAPAVHNYDVGLSYATERYSGGNPFALRDLTDGSRNAGAVFAFDTLTLNPALSLTYGARFARYDYLDESNLLSPRLEVAMTPGAHLRFNAMVSRREIAPGAEEFIPPAQTGIWLPPQRTFSSLEPGQPLRPERTTHTALESESDFGRSTVTLKVFHQHIDDQLVTLFGVNVPSPTPSTLGHYFVASGGDGNATGYSVAVRTVLSQWVKGSIEYSLARAELAPAGRRQYLVLLAPSTLRTTPERIHNVSTSIETNVPETSTRVLVLYRVSNAFARPGAGQPAADRRRFDSRFDVQVRQSLPFMDFANARWEMLVAVRNFFREAVVDQSVYDELLVVRPPKRIVGGLTMHF